jgi:branched-chain amino acid transport system ATP-binding protein
VTQAAIEVTDLHVSIKGSHILHGVDLHVPANSVTALLGRNGVGKTTTLRALINLLPSTSTHKNILDRDTRTWPTHQVIRHGVGYVPEDRDVFAALTVKENLRLAELTRNPDYDRVYSLFPDLKHRENQLAGTLSGGQQQMLALARVLLDDRPLLLIDEPTKGLAPAFVTQVVEALKKVTSTILLVEQNVHVVRKLASQVIVLDHGQVVHAGTTQDLTSEDRLRTWLGVST